ncbi:MAG: sigma-70 family RNA polymerase sigma factor [Planctomycetota bacterium]
MPNADQVHLLFLRHAEAIRGYITGLAGGDLALADDVFQEVFLVASRRAADFKEGADFTPWARGIARFKLLEVLRQRSRGIGFSEDVVELLAAEAPPDIEWLHHQRALQDCLGQLAPRARELTELRYRDQLTPTVIADRVRWTVNAVNVALARMRRQLRDCADRRLGPEAQ